MSTEMVANAGSTPVPDGCGRGRPTLRRLFQAPATTLLIVAVVAGVFEVAIHNNWRAYGKNWTGFVVFGSYFAPQTHPQAGSIVQTGGGRYGYDGQFYYALARDPLLLHDETLRDLGGETFRAERVGYPLLARVASQVTGVTLQFALVAVNLTLVLLLVVVFAWYAPRRGWSRWWALVLGFFPGFLFATLRDLTDPLATVTGLLALLAWSRGRRWLASALLTAAVLTREVMVLAVIAVLIDAVLRAWRERRREPAVVRRLVAELIPGVMIPAGAFAGWQAYITFRNGGIAHPAGTVFPFATFVRDIHDALQSPLASFARWDLAYEAIIIIGVVVALTTVWRRPNLFSIAAALFALGLSVGAFEPVWSDTRDSLPLLSVLLIGGLQDRRRLSLALCLSAAATTAAIPLAIPGIFSG